LSFSLTPRFIAVRAQRATSATVLTVFLLCEDKRLKPLMVAYLFDSTAMNRGVNEKLHLLLEYL